MIVTKVLNELINNVLNLVVAEAVNSPHNDKSDDVAGSSEQSKKKSIWICPICSVQIKHRTNVRRHQSICPSVKTVKDLKPKQKVETVFKCDHCEAQFSLQKSLTAHMKRNHLEQYCLKNKEILFCCSQCDFKCTAEKYLKAHFNKFHLPKGQFKCDICGNYYANKDSLRVHKKHSHLVAKTSVVCEFCGCVIIPSSNQDQTHNCIVNNRSVFYQDRNPNYQTGSQHFDLNSPYQVSGPHGSQVYNNNSSQVFPPQAFQDPKLLYNKPWQFHQVGVSGWQHSQFGTARTNWDWHQSIGGDWQHSRAVAAGDWQHSQAVTGDWQLSPAVTDGKWQLSQAKTDVDWQHTPAKTDLDWQHTPAKTDVDWQHTQAMNDVDWQHTQAKTDVDWQPSPAKTDVDWQHTQDTGRQHYQTRNEWDRQDFQAKSRTEQFEARVDRQHFRDESMNRSSRGDITEEEGRNFMNL